jgi:HPt (histidine-containing phosphotransfer) domain-containing protein
MEEKAKLYDLQKIYDLASGDSAFVKKLLTIFVNETPTTIGSMYEALRKGEYETLRKLAHRIKPSIHNLGINGIAGHLLDIELGNEPQNTELKLNHISSVLVEVLMEMKADLDKVEVHQPAF